MFEEALLKPDMLLTIFLIHLALPVVGRQMKSQTMNQGLIHFHSIWRYVVLIMLVLVIFKSLAGWFGNKEHSTGDVKLTLFANISLHIQLLIGLFLFFISPLVNFGPMAEMMKMPNRFWTVEHTGAMLAAVVLITVGRKIALKAETDLGKHKRTAVYYLVGLIIIFISIPWPWGMVSRNYFPF